MTPPLTPETLAATVAALPTHWDYGTIELSGALRDQIVAALQGRTWQPMETAPKDGTLIIGALIRDGKVWRIHDMKFNGLAFYTVNGGSLPAMAHWMPLPPAPPQEDR